MGRRPNKTRRINAVFRLDEDILEYLKDYADRTGCTVTDIITAALTHHIIDIHYDAPGSIRDALRDIAPFYKAYYVNKDGVRGSRR